MTDAPVFHVPERWRIPHPLDPAPGDLAPGETLGNNGAFDLDSPVPGWRLTLICSDGFGWEHVSVCAYRLRAIGWSGDHVRRTRERQTRTPSWGEMSFVKRLCWSDSVTVVQFHPPAAEYVNVHLHVLHLWRPTAAPVVLPPKVFV